MAKENPKDHKPSAVFKAGAVSLAFIILGYQASLFIHRAAVLRVEANRDKPDTVYIVRTIQLPAESGTSLDEHVAVDTDAQRSRSGRAGNGVLSGGVKTPSGATADTFRTAASHSIRVEDVRRATRRVESFRFNPNTVSVEDLVRLGFSQKQAEAIDNYREKGGRFNRKSDFAKSFVVADSVYRRLEPYISIPKLDINKADSAAFDALPGIGGYFASKMVSYRGELGGYSCTEQLMDIYHFDREKYDALRDLLCCSPPETAFRIWSLPAEELRMHPYIRSWQIARAIVFYRENNPPEKWTVDGLEAAGVIPAETASKLRRCLLSE